jgi:RsiW-degrading membrane proteinase PrsW (M82 family)
MYLSTNLTALAIIPGMLLIIYVYKKDKVEKEPVKLIIRIIIFGMISCIAAGFLEELESQFLPKYKEGTIEYALLTSFCMAAFVEEIVKYLAMRLGSWKYPGFNYRFDGIVYGVSSAVGFAIYENIMYVAMYGLSTAIVRAFTAVPLHAFCGVFMGVFYSYSKKASILGKSTLGYTLLALLVPMLIHGTYDTCAFMGEAGTMPLLVFVVILYIAAIGTIKKMSKEDYRAGFYPAARSFDIDVEV